MAERIEDLAYILHKRAYKESSYIIDMFTHQHGVVSVVAKGAKTNKSKFYLDLQLFNCLDVTFAGKTDLMTLIQAEVNRSTQIVRQKNIFCGYYVNELLLRLLHKHDRHQQLFQDYDRLINTLAETPEPEPFLRRFEKSLLIEIGYGVDLSCTVSGEPIEDDKLYIVSPGEGVVLSTSGKSSELLIKGKSLNALEAGDFSDKITLLETKLLMRRMLQYYLGNKPLKTRDLFAAQAAGN